MFVIGLISGTSADGTDIAIVDITGTPPDLNWRCHHHTTIPHPPALRQAILAAIHPETSSVDILCCLNIDLGEQFAQAALAGLAEAGLTPDQVDLIGSHGQTLWHAPEHASPATLQMGEAAVIAERTGLPVISNFRARDMALGGQGAPLVAYVDVLLLTHAKHIRIAQNIGGIGNLTFLPPHHHPDWTPFAFDTGPGNVLMDVTMTRLTQGGVSYDQDGAMAAKGRVNADLLTRLLDHSYFHRPPPKSTGRELFNQAYIDAAMQGLGLRVEEDGDLSPADLMATLTACAAQSMAQAVRNFLPCLPDEVIVSGGGANNPTLMSLISQALAPARLITSDSLGLPSEAKEAIAFAILAYETWHGRAGNLPAATGASRKTVLGQITP